MKDAGACQCSGASCELIRALEAKAAQDGYLAIILLAALSAMGFYSHIGNAFLENCLGETDQSVQQALF